MILQATVTKYIPTNAYIYADNETKHEIGRAHV